MMIREKKDLKGGESKVSVKIWPTVRVCGQKRVCFMKVKNLPNLPVAPATAITDWPLLSKALPVCAIDFLISVSSKLDVRTAILILTWFKLRKHYMCKNELEDAK